MGFCRAKLVGWIYTLIAVGVIVGGRAAAGPGKPEPLMWLSRSHSWPHAAAVRFIPQSYCGPFPVAPAASLVPLHAGRLSASDAKMLASYSPDVSSRLNIFWRWTARWIEGCSRYSVALPQTVTIVLAIVALRPSGRPSPVAGTPA